MKKKVFIFQPSLFHYRLPLFNSLSQYYDLYLSYNLDKNFKINNKINKKIKTVKTKKIKFFFLFYQSNIINKLIQNKYNIILLPHDFKNLTNYIIFILCKLYGIKLFVGGHGIYKKKINILNFIFFKLYFYFLSKFIDKFICYNNYSAKSLKNFLKKEKVKIIDNTLEKKINFRILNNKNFSEVNGIFFAGRLRNECNLELLFESAKYFKYNMKIHIIGDGEEFKKLNQLSKKLGVDCKFYGSKYNFENISKKCFVGVYPGKAGLSVVDYMICGLPIIIHQNIKNHMGPEVAYVKQGVNGFMFKENSALDLSSKINALYKNKIKIKKFSINSLSIVKNLNSVPMHKKFIKTFG